MKQGTTSQIKVSVDNYQHKIKGKCEDKFLLKVQHSTQTS